MRIWEEAVLVTLAPPHSPPLPHFSVYLYVCVLLFPTVPRRCPPTLKTSLANGVINITANHIGARAPIFCGVNRVFIGGRPEVICLANQTWSRVTGTCKGQSKNECATLQIPSPFQSDLFGLSVGGLSLRTMDVCCSQESVI